MNIIEVTQGSKEWKEVRARHFTASEAPAMMGESKYTSRSELLRQKSTGIERDIDEATQYRFNQGHDAEAMARPHAEALIGQDLYPVTCTAEIDGLPLLASLDGLTMDESTIWEHKLLNAALTDTSAELDPNYYWQLEHQLLVTGAKRVLFMASDGSNEHSAHRWYESVPERRAKLIAGWKQFAEDIGTYRHVEEKPAVVIAAIEDLPALNVQISGSVIASNLEGWRETVIARIQAINTDLQSDEDFAIAEKTVTFLSDGEKRLDAVKGAVQSQAADIDAVFRTIDKLREEMRAKRLNLDKLVKARKESIRMEIMQDAQAKLAEHVKTLNERIGWWNGCPIISPAAADFNAAIRGKKTVASLRDACDTELAHAKIATSEIADRIACNRKVMETLCDPILFPDFGQVCTKATDDFANLVAHRVTQHKEAEAKREADRIAAEQQRTQPSNPPTPLPESGAQVAAIQPGPLPVADDGARIKLGDINARLYPLSMTADTLKALGFEPVGSQGAAKLYKAGDFQAICASIVRHVQTAATNNQQMRKAA